MDARRLRHLSLALSGAGFVIAGYLTITHYSGDVPVCASGGGGCHTVALSPYAEIGGIPVAALGLGGYLMLAVAALGRSEYACVAGFALALVGAAFSGYLTYLELWVIDAICQWCVASAGVMTTLLVVNTLRLLYPEDG